MVGIRHTTTVKLSLPAITEKNIHNENNATNNF